MRGADELLRAHERRVEPRRDAVRQRAGGRRCALPLAALVALAVRSGVLARPDMGEAAYRKRAAAHVRTWWSNEEAKTIKRAHGCLKPQ